MPSLKITACQILTKLVEYQLLLLRSVSAQRPIEEGARKVDVRALEYRMKAEFQDSGYNVT